MASKAKALLADAPQGEATGVSGAGDGDGRTRGDDLLGPMPLRKLAPLNGELGSKADVVQAETDTEQAG